VLDLLRQDCSQLVCLVAADCFADIRARLSDRVQGAERLILSELGLSAYLAIATVATRARAAGRLEIQPDRLHAVVDAATALGVHCRIGRVRLQEVNDSIPETRHAALFVTDDRPGSMHLVYFGVSDLLAAGAEQAELLDDHRLLAQLFGYPHCCAEFYANSTTTGPDRVPASINALGPFDRLLNPVSRYVFGSPSLLFHFACSPACEPSISLSRQRMLFLSEIEPGFRIIENLGSGLALYGPEVGIALATEFEQEPTSAFRLHKIVTRSEATQKLFGTRTEAVIRFDTPSAFEIDGRRFSRPDQFGALFA
jgi:hypothetical protein